VTIFSAGSRAASGTHQPPVQWIVNITPRVKRLDVAAHLYQVVEVKLQRLLFLYEHNSQ
jgi:hypothetical protein